MTGKNNKKKILEKIIDWVEWLEETSGKNNLEKLLGRMTGKNN